MDASVSLADIVDALRRRYGRPVPPPVSDPFDLILWENVAYLVDDGRRKATWDALRATIGSAPRDLLNTPRPLLAQTIRDGGMHPERRADKLVRCAELVLNEYEGNLRAVLALPSIQARRALKRFPGIGEPGADKILLLTKTQAVLALDSNGLRALLRLGFGTEMKHYQATYKSVQDAVAGSVRKDFRWLIAAHLLLRRHGQTLCRRTDPQCNECPLIDRCPVGSG